MNSRSSPTPSPPTSGACRAAHSASTSRAGARNLAGVVVTNALLAGILALTGHAWVYLAWPVAFLTTFGVFLRIRSIAEHACTEASADPFRNTRTTIAGPLARLLVAPHRVQLPPGASLAHDRAVLPAAGDAPPPGRARRAARGRGRRGLLLRAAASGEPDPGLIHHEEKQRKDAKTQRRKKAGKG